MQFTGDFYQVGIVVRDIDAGMARYRDLLGLGPFWRLDTDYRGRYRDWHGRFANRNAFAKWGDVYLEMIEPVVGEGNAREWLEERGEGIFHLGYAVDDMTQRPMGVECVFESWGATLANGDAAVIHLDTVAQLGYFVELSDRALVTRLNAGIDRFIAEREEQPGATLADRRSAYQRAHHGDGFEVVVARDHGDLGRGDHVGQSRDLAADA